ncbi:hypothetical protein GQ457_03G015470 [Hibiscus cannabinus]
MPPYVTRGSSLQIGKRDGRFAREVAMLCRVLHNNPMKMSQVQAPAAAGFMKYSNAEENNGFICIMKDKVGCKSDTSLRPEGKLESLRVAREVEVGSGAINVFDKLSTRMNDEIMNQMIHGTKRVDDAFKMEEVVATTTKLDEVVANEGKIFGVTCLDARVPKNSDKLLEVSNWLANALLEALLSVLVPRFAKSNRANGNCVEKTEVKGERLKKSQLINKSFSTLGNVISTSCGHGEGDLERLYNVDVLGFEF